MTDFSKVILDLPGSDGRFELQGDIEFVPQARWNFTVNAGNGVTALSEDLFGLAGDSTSQMANIYGGAGQGQRTVVVRFVSWTGEGNEFGELPTDAPAARKAQHLEHELAHRSIDSRNPATLSYGDYHPDPDALYEPLEVVPLEVDTPFAVGNGENIHEFTGELTLAEAWNLNQVIHTPDIPGP
jgi:hypothetical protein